MTKALARNVLITGAAKRIGRALALDLAKAGWNVAVHYHRSAKEANSVVAEIEATGGKGVAIGADLASETQVEALFDAASEALGPISALVNNASVFEDDSALSATRSSWDLHMEVNLRAPFVLSQGLARSLGATRTGAIINIIDQRVWNPTDCFTSYTLSKMALWDATQVLARALAPSIRVNAIGPGPTLPSIHQTPEDFAAEVAEVPLKREVTPADISRGVMFILDSPSMTGQMIALDSGQHLGGVSKPSANLNSQIL